MRFDYAHDARPDFVDLLLGLRVPERLHWPLSVLASVVTIFACAYGLFAYLTAGAQIAEHQAEARFKQSSIDLARAQLVRTRVDDLLALDKRLREIHLSGALLSQRLADVANHVPPHAWLTALSRSGGDTTISGRAEGLVVLSDTVADLMSSTTVAAPRLVRAGKDDRGRMPGVLSFEVHVEDRDR